MQALRARCLENGDWPFRIRGIRVSDKPEVLRGVNLRIPVAKVTAIVGASGSGKTTLLKLLLALCRPTGAEITLGEVPVSALDPQPEATVYRGLREFARGRTVVVIAHRLSTVRDADQIVVLDCGRIVEIGTP